VHKAAAAEGEPFESEEDDRSATLEVDLSARFTTALFTALFTALVTASTALFTALRCELLITRRLPLARDTSAKPTARDKTPNKIRKRLRADHLTDASG
jgi:hypothetical protein